MTTPRSDDPFRNLTVTEVIRRGDARLAAYDHDPVMIGRPDAVARPSDVRECREILAYCHAHRIPVTVCGSRTSMTGSSVAESGLVLSLEKLTGIVDIGTWENRAVATVRPGMFLGDFQHAVEAEGFFYPPSPTSRNEAMIGGTIATNATGDNTYKYGTTRRYVRRLKVMLPDGSEREIIRPREQTIAELKNTAGYFLDGTEIDHFIGSEGTLGCLIEATVDLLPLPQPPFGLFVFFPSNAVALDAVIAADGDARVRPTALEFIDSEALKVVATHPSAPPIPRAGAAALIIYQEATAESRDTLLGHWFELLQRCDPAMPALLERAVLATQPGDLERLRTWRHHLPAIVNEHGQALAKNGGGKIGSDWWVPLQRMRAMMDFMYARSAASGLPYLVFGHLGNGHPHVDYLARNAEEKAKAEAMLIECCYQAVAFGGGVAGEHGLGKLKRHLLAVQHPPAVIAAMRALKERYDPRWVLGRGNIFEGMAPDL